MPLVTTSDHAHVGHACGVHPKPFHSTNYVPSQSKVTAGGSPVIRNGDSTACGDPVASFSSKVTVGGKGVHRLGDATGGHSCHFPPNSSAGGHGKVDAGG